MILAALAVTIAIQPGAAEWRATYRFNHPVEKIDFARNGRFQRKGWRIEGAGKKFTVNFPVDFTVPEGDYQLFQRYSDGSILLYTGDLNIKDVKSPRFVLTPRRGEHLIVGGRVFRSTTTWTDVDGRGTFVYFGNLRPVATADMIAVLDPAAPKWLTEKLRATLPELFADYARLTGYKLERRPTVFFSFQRARDPNSTTSKGGTLPGIIQMHVEAGDEPDPHLIERFFKFMAHEAAHMWNGQLFHSPDDQPWMHEGGADAFAWRAMRRANLIDDEGLIARETADLNQCLATMGLQSLDDPQTKEHYIAPYACGSALAWLTEAATHENLETFWKELFHRAASGSYDESLYLSILKERADAPTSEFIDDFLHRPMPDRLQRTIAAFRREGITFEPKDAAMPISQKQSWAQTALTAVMEGDCGGHVNLWHRSGTIVLGGSEQCTTLKSELTVSNVDGHDVSREGELAYDAIAARCAAGEAVPLGGISVPCTAKLNQRAPWLVVTSPQTDARTPRGGSGSASLAIRR